MVDNPSVNTTEADCILISFGKSMLGVLEEAEEEKWQWHLILSILIFYIACLSITPYILCLIK